MPWILGGIWQAPSLQACREILAGDSAGCFAVLTERWHQLIFGFKYPQEAYWRPTLAFVLLIVAVAPVLFANLPRRMLILTGLYPFIGFWLIWGGTLMAPLMGLVGFLVAYMVFQRLERSSFCNGCFGWLVAAIIVWTLGGYVSDAMSGFLALEQIPSRDMGGFMLNIILGTVWYRCPCPLVFCWRLDVSRICRLSKSSVLCSSNLFVAFR